MYIGILCLRLWLHLLMNLAPQILQSIIMVVIAVNSAHVIYILLVLLDLLHIGCGLLQQKLMLHTVGHIASCYHSICSVLVAWNFTYSG